MTPPPSRRAVVAAVPLALLTAATSGCRLRLEDGAAIPLVPRTPVPDEELLVGLVARLRETARAAASAGLAAPAADHARQADALAAALSAAGVPRDVVSPSPTTSSTASGTASSTTGSGSPSPSPARSTPAQVWAAERAGASPEVLARLGTLTTDLAPQVRSLAAYQGALAATHGAAPAWPAPPAAPSPVDAALLAAFRAAEYALDVAAARSGTETATKAATDPAATARSRLLEQARWAGARGRALVDRLGSAAAAPPLGYALPFAVATPADADRLARHAFARLELAVGDTLADATGSGSAVAVEHLVDVLVHGARWGVALRPFPGLAVPSPTLAPTASAPGTTAPASSTGASTPATTTPTGAPTTPATTPTAGGTP